MEKTFTYTARSVEAPEKMATFTMQNGDVSVKLGNAMVEQVERAFDTFHGDEENRLTAWIEPAATGALQTIMQPIKLEDFDAQMKEDSLQTSAWIRTGGLRLAPIMMTWPQVDNPVAARAFVEELERRKEASDESRALFDPFDYWITWLFAGIMAFVLPVLWWRQWQRRWNSG